MILMEGKFPLRSDLEWQKVEDGYLVKDKSGGTSVQLDAISFLVWIQCDGKTSIDSIVGVFAVGGNPDIIRAAITGVIQKLSDLQIIRWV